MSLGDAMDTGELPRGRAFAVSARTRRERRASYGLLLAACFVSVAVQGAVPPSPVQNVVVTALAAATLLLACVAARLDRRIVGAVVLVAAAALAVSVVRAAGGGIGDGAARVMNGALIALGPPAVAVGVARELRRAGQVRVEAVLGVLALYLLIGMFFGFLYGALDRYGDGSFFAGGQEATVSNCLYFSFITLATVGFGDFVARSDVGHTLTVIEALIGQIYLVTVVAVLVSNLRRPNHPAGDDGG